MVVVVVVVVVVEHPLLEPNASSRFHVVTSFLPTNPDGLEALDTLPPEDHHWWQLQPHETQQQQYGEEEQGGAGTQKASGEPHPIATNSQAQGGTSTTTTMMTSRMFLTKFLHTHGLRTHTFPKPPGMLLTLSLLSKNHPLLTTGTSEWQHLS